MKRLACSFLLAGLLLAGCSHGDTVGTKQPGPDPQTASPHPTTSGPTSTGSPSATESAGPPRVIGTVATGLEVPWGLAFLPDGSALVTERDRGRILRIQGRKVSKVGTVDETRARGEAGLLGIAASPTWSTDHRIFVYTTTDRDNRVLRMTYDGRTLGRPEPILTGIPNGFIHDGGRLLAAEDGTLFVSTGEGGEPERAQDRKSLGGKILHITQDGKQADNPSGTAVWSWGHRNVQGLAFDDDHRLWASEFGQDRWDELNLITANTNYGWPKVEGMGSRYGFRNPEVVWRTDDASPSGLAFLDGSLWMAALKGERLWRIPVTGHGAGKPQDYFVGRYGRMRTVAVAPDGNLWVTTSNRDGRGDPKDGDDRILVVRP